MPMKTRLLLLATLVALASCAPKVHESEGMTAGEEVLWMHGWMERAYGQEPEGGYENELYAEQSFAVRKYVFGVLGGFALPDEPEDIVHYFEGIPDRMIVEYGVWNDKEESRIQVDKFWSGLRMLQDYASGKSDYYPKEEVMTLVCTMLDRYIFVSDHSGLESAYEYSYMLLAYRLAQQLVRLCPDVGVLTPDHLNDAAYLNLEAGNEYQPFALVILKGQQSLNLAALVDCRIDEILMSGLEDNVYNFSSLNHYFAEDDCDYRDVQFSLQKTDEGWCFWARRGSSRGFLPGAVDSIPESLEVHIDQMQKEGIGYLPNKVQSDYLDVFNSAVKALDNYARGERRFFPDKLFKDAFDAYAFASDWDDNHASGQYWERMAILASFMEYAAYYAPDINYLTNFVSSDHNVGVFQYSGATLWNFNLYVTFKEHGVFRIKTLNTDGWGSDCGYDGPNSLTHVRKIGPDEARMYLFSHEYVYSFAQCLCWYDESGEAHFFVPENLNECICEWFTDDIRSMDDNEVHIVYNPKNVCWNVCTKVGSIYHPVKDSKTLCLKLDGLNSHYYLE